MTTKEAADTLGVSLQRVRVFIASGSLRATKPGRDWHISEADLKAFQAKARRAGRPKKKD